MPNRDIDSPPLAAMLASAEEGAQDALDELDALVPLVYAELRAIAHRRLAAVGGRAAQGTLATTALVHEAYLKLARGRRGPWRDRAHFLSVAAIAMRQILVDRARARATRKRGGVGAAATLDDDAVAADDRPDALLEIDDALDRLAAVSPRLARLVVLRFYGGMSDGEIAAALDVTVRTVQRDWLKARMLLRRALGS
jgi:RNA polymerase sigma factor (TIGR02999 family)